MVNIINIYKNITRNVFDTLLVLTGKTGFGIHPNGWWIGDVAYNFDSPFSHQLAKFLSLEECKSVVDMGCGLCDYLKHLRVHGMHVQGFDANPSISHLTAGLCIKTDISCTLPEIPKGLLSGNMESTGHDRADWGLCISVGQHIPRKREATFLYNLDTVQKRGLIASWDPPSSLAPGCVNGREPDEVERLFVDVMGYKVDQDATVDLRDAASSPALRNGLFCFRKDDYDDNYDCGNVCVGEGVYGNREPKEDTERHQVRSVEAREIRLQEHYDSTKLL